MRSRALGLWNPGSRAAHEPRNDDLEIRRPERVAGRHRALAVAVGEPALALLRRPVGEAVRHDAAGGLALQGVVADRGRGLQRGLDVAGLDQGRLAGILETRV